MRSLGFGTIIGWLVLAVSLPLAAAPAFAADAGAAQCVPAFTAPAALAGRVTALCGIHAPEDLDALPGGRYLVVSETHGLEAKPARLGLLDTVTGIETELPRKTDGGPDWGDTGCAAPAPDADFSPHGLHVSRRNDGALQLLLVDHGGREAIDFYEIKGAAGSFTALWRGCVRNTGPGSFNDVSARPGGGFVATVMFDTTDLMQNGKPRPDGLASILSGRDTGYLLTWMPGRPLRRLPGSEAPFNNGVQVSADGRFAYFAAWTGRQIRTYDLHAERTVATVQLDFLPDNLSIAPGGGYILAGITDLAGWKTCAEQHVAFCASGFRIAAWTPGAKTATTLFDGAPGMMPGASVALQSGRALYVGSFSGDRVLRIALPAR